MHVLILVIRQHAIRNSTLHLGFIDYRRLIRRSWLHQIRGKLERGQRSTPIATGKQHNSIACGRGKLVAAF